MAGYDPKDATSVDTPVPDYEQSIGASIKGMKIGIPREYRVDGMSDEIETLWQKGIEWLRDAGAEIVDISLPHTKTALPDRLQTKNPLELSGFFLFHKF